MKEARCNGAVRRVLARARIAGWLVCLAILAPAAAQDSGGGLDLPRADTAVDARSLLGLAEQGDARAMFLLGTRFASGRGGTRDDSEAVKWFRKAAEKGLAEAQFNLGVMYATGRGVPRDSAQAARWYAIAAALGMREAQFNLGVLYSSGEGVPRDDESAAQWYRKAADQGLAAAQYNLAVLFEHGRGVPLDAGAALEWYERSAALGFGPAHERLAALRGQMGGDAQATAEQAAPKATAGQATTGQTAVETGSGAQAPAGQVPAPTAAGSGTAPGSWLVTGSPAHYTLQLMSHRSREQALAFIEAHRLGERAAHFVTERDGTLWYSVVYGTYPDYASAKAAAGSLPDSLKGIEPWVRNIGKIRSGMLQ